MATGFDPYHRWLSIPPEEQPPNHYRLLGLREFEASVEVIENAASRQSTHLRPHLQSPLRPFAINLLRELEVARLCLLDGDAKCAYDDCLRQRLEFRTTAPLPRVSPGLAEAQAAAAPRASTPQPVGRCGDSPGSSSFEPAEHRASVDAIVPTIVTSHRRKRRTTHTSAVPFFFFWLSSGAIGLLAGYALLCMVGPQYDFLQLMYDRDYMQANGTENVSVPGVATQIESGKRSRPVTKTVSPPPRVATLEIDTKNPSETAPKQKEMVLVGPLADRKEVDAGPLAVNDLARPTSDLKPVKLPFDLKKRVLRVVSKANKLPPGSIFCSVCGSAELGMAPLNDLPLGEKRDLLFTTPINDVTVGAEVSFFRRNNLIVVEIRPKYRLPSGDEEAFYELAGVKKVKLLNSQVSDAMDAQSSLPTMRTELNRVTTEYQSVLPTANMASTGNGYLAQTAAQLRAAALYERGAELEKQIRIAESAAANLPHVQTDCVGVRQLGDWGAAIAQTATLTVNINANGVGLAAELK